jgi:hypothetical protein
MNVTQFPSLFPASRKWCSLRAIYSLFGTSDVFGVEVKKVEKPCGSRCEGHGGAGRLWKPQAPEHGK